MTIGFHIALQKGQSTFKLEGSAPAEGVTAIYGQSGSGKTTLLRCFAGLETDVSGKISLGDLVFFDSTKKIFIQPENRNLGMVFQEENLFPHLNIFDNLFLGIKNKTSAKHKLANIEDLFSLKSLLTRYPCELSGGEKKKVAIARSLIRDPKILLLDEPLSGIDQKSADEILKLLLSIKQTLKVPIIYVSHNLREIEILADYLVLLENQRCIHHGELASALTDFNLPFITQREAGSIFIGNVIDCNKEFNLITLQVGSQNIQVLADCSTQVESLKVKILAKDISLSLSDPEKSSIINCWKVKLLDFKALDTAKTILSLSFGNQRLLATITAKSFQELNLKKGLDIFARVKAVSIEVL